MRGALATQMSHRLSTSESFYKNVCIPSREAAKTVAAMRSCLMEQEPASASTSTSTSTTPTTNYATDQGTLPLIYPAEDLFDSEDWTTSFACGDHDSYCDQGLNSSSSSPPPTGAASAAASADATSSHSQTESEDYRRFDGYLFNALNTGRRSFSEQDVTTLLGHRAIKNMIQQRSVDSARLRNLLAVEDSLRPLRTRYTIHQLRDRIRTAFR